MRGNEAVPPLHFEKFFLLGLNLILIFYVRKFRKEVANKFEGIRLSIVTI